MLPVLGATLEVGTEVDAFDDAASELAPFPCLDFAFTRGLVMSRQNLATETPAAAAAERSALNAAAFAVLPLTRPLPRDQALQRPCADARLGSGPFGSSA